VIVVKGDRQDQQEEMVQLVHEERLVSLDQVAPLDQQDPLDQMEKKEVKAQLVHQVTLEIVAHQGNQAVQDR
jgi:hypothetical protein